MSSTVAQILEHSSRLTPDGKVDPKKLMYSTLIVDNADIADIVKDISFLRNLAMNETEPLKSILLRRVDGYDNALVSLRSIKGKMWDKLTTQTQAYSIKDHSHKKEKMSLREMIEGQQQAPQQFE